jgi:hypothetical protein
MSGNSQFLGVVQNSEFQQLMPQPGPGDAARFTSIKPQEARPPESGKLDLSKHEGEAVMIRGQDQGGWIYSAEVVDEAGPILTVVVRKVFEKKGKPSRRR